MSIACPAACHPRRAPTATSPSVRCSTPQTAHSAAPLARSTAAGTPQVAPTLGALAGCVKSKHQALVGEAVTRAASRDTVDSVDAVLSGRLTQASLSALRPRAAQTCVPHKGLGAQQTSPLLGFICSREAKQTGRVTTSDTADAETRSPGKHERKHPPSPSLVQQCASSKVPGTQLETGELGHGRQRPAKAAAHAQSVQRAACLESPERPSRSCACAQRCSDKNSPACRPVLVLCELAALPPAGEAWREPLSRGGRQGAAGRAGGKRRALARHARLQDVQGAADCCSRRSPATRRPNHGLMTLYDWGLDIGGMERSRYFGFSKDL